jgi:hypothetical protein
MPCNTEQVRMSKGLESMINEIPHLIRLRYIMIGEVFGEVGIGAMLPDKRSLQRIGLAILNIVHNKFILIIKRLLPRFQPPLRRVLTPPFRNVSIEQGKRADPYSASAHQKTSRLGQKLPDAHHSTKHPRSASEMRYLNKR